MNTTTTDNGKKRLNILDVDAELKAFEEAERKKLGLEGSVEHWVEDMVGLNFRKSERAKITMLIGGLTIAHKAYVISRGGEDTFITVKKE